MEPKIKEALEKQLQLLSESSKDVEPDELAAISKVMVQIAELLNRNENSCPFECYCRGKGCDCKCSVTIKRFVTGQEEVQMNRETFSVSSEEVIKEAIDKALLTYKPTESETKEQRHVSYVEKSQVGL